jgi:hypothetical protein
MTRNADYFQFIITDLQPSTTYRIQVDITDADGIRSGSASASQDVTTSGGAGTGLLTGSSMSHETIATRAGHTITFTANSTSAAQYVQFRVATANPKLSSCLTPSGGQASWTWDGTDGAGNPVADGFPAWSATAYPVGATGCTGTSQTLPAYSAISNVNSVGISPPPASTTIGQGESVCVTATARNRLGYLVENGATVDFAATSSPSGGAYTLSPSSSVLIGSSAPGCPAAGVGQAVVKLTVTTAVPSAITVTASMKTQVSGTTLTTVSGSTSINDPPGAPDGLEVALAGQSALSRLTTALAVTAAPPPALTVRFRAPQGKTAAGYTLLIGTAPGAYTRKIDLGARTTATVSDGLVAGQRYYVAVEAYNKVGLASRPSQESSLLAGQDGTVDRLTLELATGGQRVAAPAISTGAGAQAIPLRVTARNRAGQPVVGATVSFIAPRGSRLDPMAGQTGPDGILSTRLILDGTASGPLTIQAASGGAMSSLDVAPPPPSTTPTTLPTLTVLPSLTATAPTATVPPTMPVIPTATGVPPATPTASLSPTVPPTATVQHTATAVAPTATVPSTSTPRATSTAQPTATATPVTPTATATPVTPTATTPPTNTPSPVPTATTPPTSTAVPTSTAQPTATVEPTDTPSPIPTTTDVPTSTQEPTAEPSPTASIAPTSTPARTSTPRPTSTAAPAATPTTPPTATPPPTSTAQPTSTSTRPNGLHR